MKSIEIITTACIPWFTGTSINPLYRAAFIALSGRNVKIHFPWIEPADQKFFFPPDQIFPNFRKQEAFVYEFLEALFGDDFRSNPLFEIGWYPAYCLQYWASIFPQKNPLIFVKKSSVVILEEPEHLFLFLPFASFCKIPKSSFCGICHTNTFFYVERRLGTVVGKIYLQYAKLLLRLFCSRVFSINKDVVHYLPGMIFENIHGFHTQLQRLYDSKVMKKGKKYFLGKLIWEKGFQELIDLISNTKIEIDIFGEGPNKTEIVKEAETKNANLRFCGICYPPWDNLKEYSIFVNPSRSEVYCSTTIEAISMGKWVILPKDPSTKCFASLTNVLYYESREEFFDVLKKAESSIPQLDPKLNDDSFKKGTERLIHILDA